MKSVIYLVLLPSLLFFGCQDKKQPKAVQKVEKKEQVINFTSMKEEQKIPYALGYRYAEGTMELELSPADQKLFIEGVKAFFKSGKRGGPEMNYYARKIDQIVREKRTVLAKNEKKVGEDFVAKALAEGSYEKTKSGLLYKIVKQGQKIRKLNEDSIIKLNYTSHFLDDTQYESTMEGNPRMMSFRGMLKAWKEAVRLAGTDSSIEIIAPPSLTYGAHGAMPTIKPGQFLKFKMNFYEVINKKK